MPKVTSVEPQQKKTGRFNVFLDGQFGFGADEDTIVNYRLVPGKVLTPEELEKVLFETVAGKLMEKMYRWFGIRQRSEKEVKGYFRIKNQESRFASEARRVRIKGKEEVSDLVIDLVIERLKQKGMINDEEFAKAWVEARRRSKQKGKMALRAELLQKGVDKEIIDKVISSPRPPSGAGEAGEHITGDSEENLAQEALQKKMRLWNNLPELERKKKAIGFLLRKGFEYQTIKQVVEKFFQKE